MTTLPPFGHSKTESCIEIQQYAVDNSPAIVLLTHSGEKVLNATVNISAAPAKNCVWIKDWSENEGVAKALTDAGVIRLTGRRQQTGFCYALEAEVIHAEALGLIRSFKQGAWS